MKTLEALISLLVFLLIIASLAPMAQPERDGIYRMQLANDIWRVFSLRGDLEGFDKTRMNVDAEEITKLTSLCVELDEEDVTSCIPEEKITQVRKTAIVYGEPKTITLRVGVGDTKNIK
ncbi:MAG: hypothetical protein WCT31_03200 [Candidatus Micrarchaeia archaeon]|jgi:hypothetical protein